MDWEIRESMRGSIREPSSDGRGGSRGWVVCEESRGEKTRGMAEGEIRQGGRSWQLSWEPVLRHRDRRWISAIQKSCRNPAGWDVLPEECSAVVLFTFPCSLTNYSFIPWPTASTLKNTFPISSSRIWHWQWQSKQFHLCVREIMSSHVLWSSLRRLMDHIIDLLLFGLHISGRALELWNSLFILKSPSCMSC